MTKLWSGIPEKYGIAAWQTSLSGAGNAALTDPTAAYFNPAGLVNGISEADKIQNTLLFSLGYQKPDFKISPNGGSPLAHSNAHVGDNVISYSTLNIAAALDIRSISSTPKNVPISLGIVAVLAGDGTDVVKFSEESAKFYKFHGIGRDAVRPSVAASLAAQVWKEHISIGIGSVFLAGVDGKIEVLKIYTSDLPPITELAIAIKLKPSAIAGIQYRQPIKEGHTLYFGTSWRQENFVAADVRINVQLPPISGISVLHATALHLLGYYEPHVFTAGIAYEWKRVTLYADIEYQMWSRFSRGLTRELLEGLPGFKDIWIPRGGTEVALPFWDLKIRTGYGYIPPITPQQSGSSNYLDNGKHLLSFGLGKIFGSLPRLNSRVKLDVAFQWQYWVTRETVKNVQDILTDGTYQPGYFYGGNIFLGHVSVTTYL